MMTGHSMSIPVATGIVNRRKWLLRAWFRGRLSLAVGVLIAAALSTPAAWAGAGIAGGSRWQNAPIWNDGKAEVSSYKATESKYGTPRDFTAYFIVVAEDLRNDTLVKSDTPKAPGGLTRVLKMNQVYDIQTGMYAYRQMVSVFLRLSDFAPVKESVTSHEWCGNTFVILQNRDGKGTLRGFSYFDGEAERTQSIDLTGATLYDDLPLAIRAVPFGYGLERQIRIASQLLNNRIVTVKVTDAILSVQGLETVTTGMGPMEGWRVDLKHPDGLDQFWVERNPPNRLLQWNQADGGKYVLQSSRRLAYWALHEPADANALSQPEPPRD